ncbi:recombinase family protein [Saccharopolyspora hordei]
MLSSSSQPSKSSEDGLHGHGRWCRKHPDRGRAQLRSILENPRYTGCAFFGRWTRQETLLDPDDVAAGHVVRFHRAGKESVVRSRKPAHPAIVSVETFVEVQLRRRARTAGGLAASRKLERGPKKTTKRAYPLVTSGPTTGVLRARWCRARRCSPTTRRTSTCPRLRCWSSFTPGSDTCSIRLVVVTRSRLCSTPRGRTGRRQRVRALSAVSLMPSAGCGGCRRRSRQVSTCCVGRVDQRGASRAGSGSGRVGQRPGTHPAD